MAASAPSAQESAASAHESVTASVKAGSSFVPADRPRLPEEVAARLAAWEAAEELRRTREEEAAAVAEAAEAARAARSPPRRMQGGQKSSASLASTNKHHGAEKSRSDPNRPRMQTDRFRLRHGASAEEMLRDYRRLVTYPRQCPVLKAQLVLRSRPLSFEQPLAGVASRYRQTSAEFHHTASGLSSKGDVVVVSTAPAVTDFRNPPKQGGGGRLPPPRWDRWLASRHPPERDEAALVPTPVHMPPLPDEPAAPSVWAAIGARDSWTSFKLDSPPPQRSSMARAPPHLQELCCRQPPPQVPRPPPPPLLLARPPPPSAPQLRASSRLDLESCLSVVSLQAPDITPTLRPRPQPPPRRFELVRNVTAGDSPSAGVSVAPVLPAVRRRQSPPQPRPPEPTRSQPPSPNPSPRSSISVPSSQSAPTSPRYRNRQDRS